MRLCVGLFALGSFQVLDALLEIIDVVDSGLRVLRSARQGCFRSWVRLLLGHTWRIANLCISCPRQAGIMFLRVENSSFILDRRRRSIKLWAVFRAILRPAALVALGCCFFLKEEEETAVDVEALEEFLVVVSLADAEEADVLFALPLDAAGPVDLDDVVCVLGFIWMILRARVGGGGRSRSSSGRLVACRDALAPRPVAVRFGEVGESSRRTDAGSGLDGFLVADGTRRGLRAAGGSEKVSTPSSTEYRSLTMSSPDVAGVGGRRGGDMAVAVDESTRGQTGPF